MSPPDAFSFSPGIDAAVLSVAETRLSTLCFPQERECRMRFKGCIEE